MKHKSGSKSQELRRSLSAAVLLLALCNTGFTDWQEASHRAVLTNKTMEVRFQAGFVFSLTDRLTQNHLLSIDPSELPSRMLIFDTTPTDLNKCEVNTEITEGSVTTTFVLPGGDQWKLEWSIEAGKGDLTLRATARTSNPVEFLRYSFFGCDIAEHALVWINNFGAAAVLPAPWTGVEIGDPQKDESSLIYCHPLVALFQGEHSGWFIEGREPRVGPANIFFKGTGNAANVGMVRRFPIPKKNPELYEIRIRTYQDQWEDAVDPYIEWMEQGAGYVPLEKLSKAQAWVNDLQSQTYLNVGDHETLEALAGRVNPARTFLGSLRGWRFHGPDIALPDYRVTEKAKRWFRRADELGFRVAAHFNTSCIARDFPELLDRFRPGFAIVDENAQGTRKYQSVSDGYLVRCSPAFKPWRDYLVEQMREVVDAGIDCIHLDEAMAPTGKYMVDGVNGIEGTKLLIQQVQDRYPGVVVQTEAFNTLTTKFAQFAESQMPLGHPLSGYIFRRYVKVVWQGVMYSPTDVSVMDASDSWGFALPGADPNMEESWMQIVDAYQKYGLVPDSRLPRRHILHTRKHWTSGVLPIDDLPAPPEGVRLFGFRGNNEVTAFFEKHPTRRGLVVYEPDRVPRWFGTRHFNIRQWDGPGVPAYYGFREPMRDWLIYNEHSILGLDPDFTYSFDESIKRPSLARFHLYKVTDDFRGASCMNFRIPAQEFGRDGDFYFIRFGGHGEIGAYIPEEYDAYLNGRKLAPDPRTHRVTAVVNNDGIYHDVLTGRYTGEVPDSSRPAELMVFRRIDTALQGNWSDLPLHGSNDSAKWIKANAEGGYKMSVSSIGRFVGRIPDADHVFLEGHYRMNQDGISPPATGVIKINGVVVLRLPPGLPPFPTTRFEADLSDYAGEHALLEFVPDSRYRGTGSADWIKPRIVTRTSAAEFDRPD